MPRPVHQAPLRILALAPQAGIPSQVREEERQARRTAWKPLIDSGQVVMEELSPVTRAALVDALQSRTPPDVVHYYGHGEYHDGEGMLLLDDPHDDECWTGASALMTLLGGVRMVTLFACQGAMVARSGGLLTGVAPALSAAGIPIVMGMQFTVRVNAATRASGVMYRALAAGWSVQQAASLVRQALYVEENDRASWYVPVLYVRTPDTAPICLVTPSEQRDTHTRPLTAAPPRPAAPAAPGARQSITARQNSRAGGIVMQGQAGSGQAVSASQHSTVERARLHAAGGGQQDIQAEEASEIVDVELDA
jgi:hypothetical protein